MMNATQLLAIAMPVAGAGIAVVLLWFNRRVVAGISFAVPITCLALMAYRNTDRSEVVVEPPYTDPQFVAAEVSTLYHGIASGHAKQIQDAGAPIRYFSTRQEAEDSNRRPCPCATGANSTGTLRTASLNQTPLGRLEP